MASALEHAGRTRDPSSGGLPSARQLATLGTVLCIYRAQLGSELAGWHQAVRAEACTGVDSDGLNESLLFFDAHGRCCWRLCLLPDSDFLAWDRLLGSLPVHADDDAGSLGERLWRRLAGKLIGGQWRACALRLHALRQDASSPLLAASLSPTSMLGAETALRIAATEGAEADGSLADCCCAQAAFAASRDAISLDADTVPLIRIP